MSHVKVMMVKHDKREIEQLKHVFEDMPDYEYIGCCEKGDEAVKKIAEDKPDIVIRGRGYTRYGYHGYGRGRIWK